MKPEDQDLNDRDEVRDSFMERLFEKNMGEKQFEEAFRKNSEVVSCHSFENDTAPVNRNS